jgi:hypothetical protein
MVVDEGSLRAFSLRDATPAETSDSERPDFPASADARGRGRSVMLGRIAFAGNRAVGGDGVPFPDAGASLEKALAGAVRVGFAAGKDRAKSRTVTAPTKFC